MKISAPGTLKYMASVFKARPDLMAGVLVTMVVMMMIVPLPKAVLDAAIAANFSAAILLVALASYVPNPLAFSTFPIILLIATAFRLSISISTTRLVLLDADAGAIVEAFGTFVVRGNLVVGLVMFLIITVVQFLVVTKGAERIAEVSARFSLDALPGKQLSIDADLRAGFIDAREAKLRRTNLSRESQLFGAMDGTMKFVKGDAIAGLIIVAVNLMGGVTVGVFQRGMSAGEALHRYAVLTIGDGLIAQIPALLIALSAGLLIARVGPVDDTGITVGDEMSRQILSEPRAWIFSSIVIMMLALLPGMPITTFSALALGVGLVGLSMQKKSRRVAVTSQQLNESGVTDLRTISPYTPLSFRASRGMAADEETHRLSRVVRQVRNNLVTRYGLTLPNLVLEFSDDVPSGELQVCVHETPQLRMTWLPGHIAWRLPRAAPVPALAAELANESVIPKATMHEEGWCWVPDLRADAAREAGLMVRTFDEMLIDRVRAMLLDNGYQFIGMQEVRAFLSWLDREAPELAKEMQRTMATAKISFLLQQLARERVPVRNFRLISEIVITSGLHDRDPEVVVDMLRKSLRDDILSQYLRNGKIPVCMLHPEVEGALRSAYRDSQNGVQFDLPPGELERILGYLFHYVYEDGDFQPHAIVVVAQDLRRALWEVAANMKRFLPVLAYPELSPSFEFQVLGHVEPAPAP
jgi:type III secretion protein V